MQMNLPNKLTTMRVILIPVFLLVLFLMDEPMNRYIATAIFIVASLTDFLDGHIARKYNLVSNFGKFMDPLADKLLVMSALVSMVAMEDLPAWVVIVILAREFAITGFRCGNAHDRKYSGGSGSILYYCVRCGLYCEK